MGTLVALAISASVGAEVGAYDEDAVADATVGRGVGAARVGDALGASVDAVVRYEPLSYEP